MAVWIMHQALGLRRLDRSGYCMHALVALFVQYVESRIRGVCGPDRVGVDGKRRVSNNWSGLAARHSRS